MDCHSVLSLDSDSESQAWFSSHTLHRKGAGRGAGRWDRGGGSFPAAASRVGRQSSGNGSWAQRSEWARGAAGGEGGLGPGRRKARELGRLTSLAPRWEQRWTRGGARGSEPSGRGKRAAGGSRRGAAGRWLGTCPCGYHKPEPSAPCPRGSWCTILVWVPNSGSKGSGDSVR